MSPRPARRRSRLREAQARQAAQRRRDDRATRTVLQIATAGVLLAFAVTIVAVLEGPAGFSGLEPLARPVVGPFTMLELIGAAAVIGTGLLIWRRLKK